MAALEPYRRRRNFKATTEPPGEEQAAAAGNRFVVQKHATRRLHYDLRLEMDGVLKSWAVTRGPSLTAGEKRLAVHVEDHPLEYGDFEGTIPRGQYGGGTVIVWDRGTWSPIGDMHRGYRKGHLEFELSGEKLGGRWHLVRMASGRGETKENWLLIKGDDDRALPEGADDILQTRPESVKTGRVVEEVASEAPPGGKAPATSRARAGKTVGKVRPKGVRAAPLPAFVEPLLAARASKPPTGKRWIHEIKFDGYRLQARIDSGRIKLLTRSGLDWTRRFGKDVVAALSALPVETALLDGELVVENENGVSDFPALQARLSAGSTDGFVYYAFDLLHLDGGDLREVPLRQRKEALAAILAGSAGPVRLSEHFGDDGALILRHACRLSLEGVISKLAGGPYRSGRSADWLKSKCSERQELVVAGYVPSSTTAGAIGSLVMGYYQDGRLIHAGRVGTGYSAAVARDLHHRLEQLRRPDSPFADVLEADAARQVRFVEPQLVAEVEFRGWTADRSLRHASFRGLREDKAAEQVVREPTGGPAERPLAVGVRLTHPDRLYWPEAGVTKEGLAQYYAQVWQRMAPFVVARPLALVRCPNGISGQCFFQKHPWRGLHRSIRLRPDPGQRSGEPLLTIDDLDGLTALVQAGVLELHPWGAAVDAIDRPDMIIMDLDPGEGVAWVDVVAAAVEARERLAARGLASFVKTSGGKGLHVVAPLRPAAEWPAVKAFAKALAEEMAQDSPERFVAKVTKSIRKGRILVDYLRNGRGSTAVAAYSSRARPGAPVSMPLAWDELGDGITAGFFTVLNAPARLDGLERDPWAGFRGAAVPLPARQRQRAA